MLGGGLRGGERAAEDRVRAQTALRRRAVQLDEGRVDLALVVGAPARQQGGQLAVHMRDGRHTPLPSQRVVAVAELDRLVLPVDAPDGTAARPNAPDSSPISTSTVGLPRESRIWRPCTCTISSSSELLLRAVVVASCSSRPSRARSRRRSPRAPPRARPGARSVRWSLRSASSGSTLSLRATLTIVKSRSPTSSATPRRARSRARVSGGRHRLLELVELLAHLRERPCEIGPVVPDCRRAPLHLPRMEQRRAASPARRGRHLRAPPAPT